LTTKSERRGLKKEFIEVSNEFSYCRLIEEQATVFMMSSHALPIWPSNQTVSISMRMVINEIIMATLMIIESMAAAELKATNFWILNLKSHIKAEKTRTTK